MQKPTAPTLLEVTASWPSRKSTAPPRSLRGPVDGQGHHHLARAVGVVRGLAAVQVGGEGDEALLRQAVADVGDVVGEAPPLLDDDDARAAAALGEGEVAVRGAVAAGERGVLAGRAGGVVAGVLGQGVPLGAGEQFPLILSPLGSGVPDESRSAVPATPDRPSTRCRRGSGTRRPPDGESPVPRGGTGLSRCGAEARRRTRAARRRCRPGAARPGCRARSGGSARGSGPGGGRPRRGCGPGRRRGRSASA